MVLLSSLATLATRKKHDSVLQTSRMRSIAPSEFSLGSVYLSGIVGSLPWQQLGLSELRRSSLISLRMASKVMASVSDVDVLLGGILSTKGNT
ncbi:hypothetical protein Tco_0157922 [Tanacetum coccineum]